MSGRAGDGPAAELPGGETMERLASIWREFLETGSVGPETDFFEAGGHSLLAVEVVLRTQDEFGIDLPMGTLFEVSTLAEMARRVEAHTEDTEEFTL